MCCLCKYQWVPPDYLTALHILSYTVAKRHRQHSKQSNPASKNATTKTFTNCQFHIQHNKSSALAETGDRLATIEMGRNFGGLCLFGCSWVPSNTVLPRLSPTSAPSGSLIHPAIWPQRTWAENLGKGAVPLFGGAGFPSNTMWPGSRPTSTPSFIFIYLTVWSQYTNVTDRDRTGHDRQNGPIV